MNNLSPLIEALGWTLLHFLWQGTVVAVVVWISLRVMMRRTTPQARYGAAGAALMLMLGTAAGTLWWQGNRSFSAAGRHSAEDVSAESPGWRSPAGAPLEVVDPALLAATGMELAPSSQGVATTSGPGPSQIARGALESFLSRFFPWLVGVWAAGSGILSLRLLNSWRLTRRLRLAAKVLEDTTWASRFATIVERLRVSRSVRLLSSTSAAVPMVIGWLKPVVLVPAALFAGLPASQLEAILAHELAHVRRHDYLVNLLQTVVETLFFYHPAVWWVSGQLRTEREHCCDDVASSMCTSPLDYARALAALEEVRSPEPMLGMAATGGSLLARIRRLLGAGDDHLPAASGPLGLFALVVLVAAVPLTLLGATGQPAASVAQAKAEAKGVVGRGPETGPPFTPNSADPKTASKVARAGAPESPAPVLQFRLVADAAGPDTEPLAAPQAGDGPAQILHVEKSAILGPSDVALALASPHPDKPSGPWSINLLLTEEGGKKLSKTSKANLGRRLAIVVNGTVVSAPTIRDEIGKEIMISGNFSETAARKLVRALETRATGAGPELKEVVIVMGKQGTITLDGEPTAASGLETKLKALTKPDHTRVVIRADPTITYRDVVGVVEICQKAGLAIRLATEPEDAAKAGGSQSNPSGATPEPAKPPEAVPSAIRLNVVDSTGGKPIREFRVVAGVKSQASEGKEVVNWQPHTVRLGTDGVLDWPMDKAYDPMALRIEADGYAPQVSAWIKKSEGVKAVPIRLVPDDGTAGRVLTPEGRPAAGAAVALAMVQRDAVIEGGKLRHLGEAAPEKLGDRWRWPVFVTADADGRFRLPAENDPTAAVLIVHGEGVRELALAEFKKSSEVTLQAWGRLEGRVLWGDRAGADQSVSVTIHRDVYGYPGVIAQYEKTRSAANGSFIVERVLPGLAQVSCPIQPGSNPSGITEINLTGQTTHVTVQPGATPVLIGGQGRSVNGRLTGRDSWEGVTFHFHPTAPHVGFPGDDEMWKAWGEFQKSPVGASFFRAGLKVKADGTFEIPAVLPGDYQIFFSREGEPSQVASGKFNVSAEIPGKKPEAQDIGEFKAGK